MTFNKLMTKEIGDMIVEKEMAPLRKFVEDLGSLMTSVNDMEAVLAELRGTKEETVPVMMGSCYKLRVEVPVLIKALENRLRTDREKLDSMLAKVSSITKTEVTTEDMEMVDNVPIPKPDGPPNAVEGEGETG